MSFPRGGLGFLLRLTLLYFKMPSNLIEQFNQKGASRDFSAGQATWAHRSFS